MNQTEALFPELEDILKPLYEKDWTVIGFYISEFTVAVVANVLVIFVVIKDQYMRSVTNYFLVNLAVADLLVALVCMPDSAYKAYTSIYAFGEYTCKFSAYLQCVSVALSIFTITAMALDRYLAITRPFGIFYRCFNKKTAITVILLLWIFSFSLFSPILLVVQTVEILPKFITLQNRTIQLDVTMCQEEWTILSSTYDMKKGFGIAWFICMFVVPGLLILFAYSMMSRTLCMQVPPLDNNDGLSCMQQRNRLMRGRKRVACILLLLIFIFACCWLPYHIITLKDDIRDLTFKNKEEKDEHVKQEPSHRKLKMYLLLLGHANSALNPIIYCILSRKFRISIKEMICTSIDCIRRRNNPQKDTSGSASQLQSLRKIKTLPSVQNRPIHLAVSRLQSQKSTKTCTV